MSAPPRRTFAALLAAALAAAAGLRLAAASAEFWFDEVWSWQLARGAGSAWDVLAGLRHDNNHQLNTLYLYFCPDGLPWPCYRAHALLAGVLAVALAACAAAWRGRADAVFAAALTATSYWLVLASAEARGYALAVCFALLAYAALRRRLGHGEGWPLPLFWAAVILGFLSHLTFLHAYLGLLLWSVHHYARRRGPGGGEVRPLLLCHAVPGAFAAAFYVFCVRGMELGGGPPASTADVLASLAGVGLGGRAALPWLLAAAVVIVWGLRLLVRAGDDAWVFFAIAVVAAPATFLLKRPPFLFERYFLIPFVFFLVLLAHVLGDLWWRGTLGRVAAAGLLAAFVAGNLLHIEEFVRHGRGRFHEALACVARADETATLTGDHDFRVAKMCAFYAPYAGGRLVYVSRDELPPRGTGWLLVHRLDNGYPPAEVERDAHGNAYRLAWAFPSRGRGCWGWFVYRNASTRR
jgi:hypothetical protein